MRTNRDRFEKVGATFVVSGPGVDNNEAIRREDSEFDMVYSDHLSRIVPQRNR